MKKIIAWVLLLAMLLGTFAGCGSAEQATEPAATEGANNAAAAIDYLKAIYKDYGAKTFSDFERPSTLRIDGVPYEVEWTVDVAEDLVKVVAGEEGKATIDINEQCETETAYNLTATVTDDAGNTASHSWNYILPAVEASDYENGQQVVLYNPGDARYVTGTDYLYTSSSGSQKHELVLSENKADAVVLAIQNNNGGTISFVSNDLYLYCDGTHVMFVAEQSEYTKFVLEPCEGGQLIRCATASYGDKAQYLELYSGYMTCYSYNAEKVGLYAFNLEDAEGANGVAQEAEAETATDMETVSDVAQIMKEAFELDAGESLPYKATLTGVITDVVTPFSTQYNNITVNIEVDGYAGKTVQCFRLKGDGAEDLGLFDTITVTGKMTNYKGTIEFEYPTLDKVVKNETETVTDAAKVRAEAEALGVGERLPYVVELTGTVHSIMTGYSPYSSCISVAMWVDGTDFNLKCMEMVGDDLDTVNINDEITVSGVIGNINGGIFFIPGSKMIAKVDCDKPEASYSAKQIFKDAESLHEGAQLLYNCNLTGTITKVNTPYTTKNNNITVTIAVEGYEDRPIRCYELAGPGVDTLNADDVITVSGAIGLKNGSLGLFGGALIAIPVQTDPPAAPSDPKQIVDEAFALPVGETLGYTATLTGPITRINTAYSSKYGNITVSITVYGTNGAKTLMCYRLAGDGAADLAVGDTITVTGIIKNYNGTIEFDQGCTLVSVVKGESGDDEEPTEAPSEPEAGTLSIAEALALGQSKDHNSYTTNKYTVTGVITSVYNTTYGNMYITDGVNTIVVYGLYSGSTRYDSMTTKPVAGDTITINGVVGQYNGTAQFKNAQLVSHTPATEDSTEAPTEEPTEAPSEPEADTLSIAEALALGQSKDHNSYTTNKYTVTGVITSVYNTTYGNMYITDGVNTIVVYGLYSGSTRYDSMTTKPVAGDTITINGVVGQFNGNAQFKNAQLVSHTPAATEDATEAE